MPVTQPFTRAQVERIIGGARVALAAACLFAVWLDPAEPSRYAAATYTFHIIYVVYTALLALAVWRRAPVASLPLATLIIDIGVGSVLQYLTLGPSSPFFMYFIFVLFSATLRWGSRGTLRTAAVVLPAYMVMGWSLSRTLGPAEFELNRFIIRIAYLLVATALLASLSLHEERLRDDVRRLARWPVMLGHDLHAAVPQILAHSSAILGARHALLVWSHDDEPWLYVACWPPPAPAFEKCPPGVFEPVVPPELADGTFVSGDALSDQSQVIVSRAGESGRWRGLPMHVGLQPRLQGIGIASAPFATDRLSGRAFFSSLPMAGSDIMPLLEVVGREIGASLDQLVVYEQSREVAVAEDRIRLARDLHDGVLQSLTSVRYELQHLADQSDDQAGVEELGDRLRGIERALSLDQRELRQFIEHLRPRPRPAVADSLRQRLDALRQRLEPRWRTRIDVQVHPDDLAVPEVVDRAVVLMVHEAVTNALRHGRPTRVSVDVRRAGDTLVLVIGDDGRGFTFRGRLDHAALEASDTGPISLRERVTSFGGRIAVESTTSGATVELSIPLEAVHD